jgi:hypothetical protein
MDTLPSSSQRVYPPCCCWPAMVLTSCRCYLSVLRIFLIVPYSYLFNCHPLSLQSHRSLGQPFTAPLLVGLVVVDALCFDGGGACAGTLGSTCHCHLAALFDIDTRRPTLAGLRNSPWTRCETRGELRVERTLASKAWLPRCSWPCCSPLAWLCYTLWCSSGATCCMSAGITE